MDDDELKQEQARVARWIDPAVRSREDLADADFDLEFHYSRDDAAVLLRNRLRTWLEHDPALRRIMLVCEDERVAVGIRDKVLAAPGTAGASAGDLGSGERAGLPGRSTRYRLLRFACGHAGCGKSAHTSYYDERFPPVCDDASHGPMKYIEVVR